MKSLLQSYLVCLYKWPFAILSFCWTSGTWAYNVSLKPVFCTVTIWHSVSLAYLHVQKFSAVISMKWNIFWTWNIFLLLFLWKDFFKISECAVLYFFFNSNTLGLSLVSSSSCWIFVLLSYLFEVFLINHYVISTLLLISETQASH